MTIPATVVGALRDDDAEHPETLLSMNALAELYSNQGRSDEAELLLLKTLEIKKRVLGEEHPQTLRAMTILSNLYSKQGRYDEAEPLYLETLEISKRVLGEEHPATLWSKNGLVDLYVKQGRYEQAESIRRELRPEFRKLVEAVERRGG